MTGSAEVLLGDEVIADLERFDDEVYLLHFRKNYRERAPERRPVLGLFFEDRLFAPVTTESFPAWFANALPQGPLRGAIARSIGATDIDHWELLLALGEDLPGGVRVRGRATHAPRAQGPPPKVPVPAAGLRSSLAGVQPKISPRDASDGGLVLPLAGEEGELIAKLHDPRFPGIVRVEQATTRWAHRCGVRVPETSQPTSPVWRLWWAPTAAKWSVAA